MKVRINNNDRVMIGNELGATIVFIKKKIIVFLIVILLLQTGCGKNQEKTNGELIMKNTIIFNSGEEITFNELEIKRFTDEEWVTIPINSNSAMEEIFKFLSELKRTKIDYLQESAFEDGSIVIEFDNPTNDKIYLIQTEKSLNRNLFFYQLDSNNTKLDGVYESELDLISEIEKILK